MNQFANGIANYTNEEPLFEQINGVNVSPLKRFEGRILKKLYKVQFMFMFKFVFIVADDDTAYLIWRYIKMIVLIMHVLELN